MNTITLDLWNIQAFKKKISNLLFLINSIPSQENSCSFLENFTLWICKYSNTIEYIIEKFQEILNFQNKMCTKQNWKTIYTFISKTKSNQIQLLVFVIISKKGPLLCYVVFSVLNKTKLKYFISYNTKWNSIIWDIKKYQKNYDPLWKYAD